MTEKQCRDKVSLEIWKVFNSLPEHYYKDYRIVLGGIHTWKYPGEGWKGSFRITFYEN